MEGDQTSSRQGLEFTLHSKKWRWSWDSWSRDAHIQPGGHALNRELRNLCWQVCGGGHLCTLWEVVWNRNYM